MKTSALNPDRNQWIVVSVIVISAATVLLVAWAPVLTAASQPLASGLLYLFFAPLCHQLPERCFSLLGFPLAVCQRCFGIYFGLFLGSLSHLFGGPKFLRTISNRTWIVLASLPLMLDVCLAAAHIASSTPWTRFVTGLIFGAMLAAILLPALVQFVRAAHWREGSSDTRNVRPVQQGGSPHES